MGAYRWKERLETLESQTQGAYPDLHLAESRGELVLRGSFPIRHEGEELDRFLIEVSFPDGPNEIPVIHEIGGRIPRIANRHVNPATGDICTDVPELVLLRSDYSLLGYLNGPVRNFFISQHLVEKGEPWPFGQWKHGRAGLIEAYGEILGVSDAESVFRFLECLSLKAIKGHLPCPCGNGKRVRACHRKELDMLHSKIPADIALQALARLAKTP